MGETMNPKPYRDKRKKRARRQERINASPLFQDPVFQHHVFSALKRAFELAGAPPSCDELLLPQIPKPAENEQPQEPGE